MKNSKPTIYDSNFLPTNIYSGVPTFLNLPVLENKQDLAQMDVAVMGVPWEGGCTIGGYSSCTDGPKSIRSASIRYTGYLPDFDLDCFSQLKAGDYGDIAVQNGNYEFTFGEIRKKVGEIYDAGAVPIIRTPVAPPSISCTTTPTWTPPRSCTSAFAAPATIRRSSTTPRSTAQM